MKTTTFIAACFCALTTTSHAQHSHIPLTITHTFQDAEQPSTFPILIDTPANFDPTTHHAVILFHGGYLSDPHWTVPGSYTQNDETIPITIDGQPTKDADTIAQALISAGYAVVRYGSIHTDPDPDAQPDTQPRPISFPQTVTLADLVQNTALEQLDITPDQCITLGHSLGAARAILTAPDAAGHIILAGAYMTPTMNSPHQLARDADKSARAKDYDQSGSIEPFEFAAYHAIKENTTRTHPNLTNNNHSYTWPSDTLLENKSPTLALWGSLDATSYHAPILTHLYNQADLESNLTTHYFHNLGHNLSAQEKGRIDKIDPAVIDSITDWLIKHYPNE
jgi:pimeloyl-ACP methyl ester carboxylesterase